MHSNLKNLVAHYKNPPLEGGQHPISKIDADILTDLVTAVGLLNGSTPLVEILDCWKKKQSDEKIAERLEEFILTLESSAIEGEEESGKKFITIEGSTLELGSLFSIDKEDAWDHTHCREEFNITINRCPDAATNLPAIANRVFKYYVEQERDDQYEDIKSRMKSQGKVVFL